MKRLPPVWLMLGVWFAAPIVASESSREIRFSIEVAQEQPRGARNERPYAALPLESGDHSRAAGEYISIDSEGETVSWFLGGPPKREGVFFEPTSGRYSFAELADSGTYGQTLSGDGRTFFYDGSAQSQDGFPAQGVVALSRVTGTSRLVYATSSAFFSVDHAGRRVAFQSASGSGAQYLLADLETGEVRQITNDPQAIVYSLSRDDCPYTIGTTPLINAAGTRIAIATRATLGLVDPDPAVGCHIVVYDIAQGQFRHVTALPRALTLERPAISADGRWLSFSTSRPIGNGLRRYTAALLDLDSGTLTESVLGPPGDDQTFVATITADGSAIVVASNGDLDPTVGNADHNMELFILDRAGGRVQQVTDTTGGIGPHSGTCPFPYFAPSGDGSVIAVMYLSEDEEPCFYDGPPRHRETGLYYRATRLVRRRAGNQAPEWQPAPPPAEATVAAGATLTLELGGRDADGDRLTFFAQEVGNVSLPDGASFVDHHDGTATFTWPTRVEQAGSYTLRTALFDEGGDVRTADVRIVIGPRGGRACPGDCDGDGAVTVPELVTAVGIAQEQTALATCAAADGNADGAVTVEELISATRAALQGCPPP